MYKQEECVLWILAFETAQAHTFLPTLPRFRCSFYQKSAPRAREEKVCFCYDSDYVKLI